MTDLSPSLFPVLKSTGASCLRRYAFVAGLTLILVVMSVATSWAEDAKPPENGILFDPATAADLSSLKCTSGVQVSLGELKDTKMIKLDIPKVQGFPGFSYAAPGGGAWDLSGYAGAEVVVSNPGTVPLNVSLKFSNDGDWHNNPSSAEFVNLDPGTTQTLTVVFGQSFGHPAFKLDPSHIIDIRVFTLEPASATSLLVGPLKLIKAK